MIVMMIVYDNDDKDDDDDNDGDGDVGCSYLEYE